MRLTLMLLLWAVLFSVSGETQVQRFDLLIVNGQVIDGTGNPWFKADIGIRDGRIVSIGRFPSAQADRIIDAKGKYVVPGFIDIHSHSDEGLGAPATRVNPNMIAQGVTTVVVNQDGRSPWPISRQKEAYERNGIGTNAILMVGHGAVRGRVMKNDYRRPATKEEIDQMAALVKQGMEEGAFGLSAGLEYVPGRWSVTDELVALVAAIAPYNGFYISHERSEGRDPMWKNASDPTPSVDLLQAVKETIEISARTGVASVASHLKAKGATYWGSSHAATRMIAEARSRGVQIYADQYPYPTSGSDGSTVLVPMWALADDEAGSGDQLGQLGRGGRDPNRMRQNFQRRLDSPETNRRIRLDIAHEIDRRGGADKIVIYDIPQKEYIEKSVAEVAATRREDIVDTVIWIQLNGNNRPGGARMRGFSLSEVDIEHIMQQEFTATCSDAGTVAIGDGIPHPRFYGTFPRKIRRYVLERKIISMPFAIRSMTSLPAQIIGLKDRGLLREGAWADIVIFDPEKIADRATYTQPHQYPLGIDFVIVNGSVTVDEGRILEIAPGKVLIPAK